MKTISEFLIENKKKKVVSFAEPGHKSRAEMFTKAGYGEFFSQMLSEDISEIPGADSLFRPTSTILEVMENYADLYGVKHTELLVNGCSAGVIAAILASVSRGGKLILGRNSHHSAYSALRLGGIQPVYMRPEYMDEYKLQAGISADEVRAVCEDNPDAEAVLITSPNCYGMVSNIPDIADVVHECGMILIVDQSHGAHLKFFDAVTKMTFSAEDCGADIVINGTSKTLLSLAETGIMNVCTDEVDIDALSDCLKMVQTTSPSYLLLGSLDINEQIMRRWGGDMVVAWLKDLQYVYNRLQAISGVTVVARDELDVTKITLSLANLGVTGEQLETELRRDNIVVETVHGDYVTLLTGAGNCRDDYMKLVSSVRAIAGNYAVGKHENTDAGGDPCFVLGATMAPDRKELVPLYRADGRVIYEPIVTYPPGSPIACPGEIMNMELISYIAKAWERGEKVSGIDEEGQIFVGIEEFL